MSSLKKWRRGVVLSGLAASVLAGCETETMVVKPGDVSSCMVGDVKCEQSRLYTCETDGRTGSWSFLQRCAKGCAEDLVTCRDEETVVGCRSGDIRCVRDMLQECVSSGGVSSWKTDGACEEGCNSAGTACRVPTSPEPNPGKCTLGAQKCEGSTVYQCRTDASGTAGWRESETCALGCNESETACELSGGGGCVRRGRCTASRAVFISVWGEKVGRRGHFWRAVRRGVRRMAFRVGSRVWGRAFWMRRNAKKARCIGVRWGQTGNLGM